MTRAFGLTIRKMFIDNKRIFIRFIVSLTVCIALIGVLCSVTAFAADNNASGNAGTTTSIGDTASANTSGGTTDNITLENYSEKLGFETVIPAFIVSELKRAFQMGFLIFIPFLVIDLVVSSTLMAMGMMMLPPAMISLPFKIILFVLVDGWQLMVGTIVNSYNL